jgi:hypothetical protein
VEWSIGVAERWSGAEDWNDENKKVGRIWSDLDVYARVPTVVLVSVSRGGEGQETSVRKCKKVKIESIPCPAVKVRRFNSLCRKLSGFKVQSSVHPNRAPI